MDTGRRAAVTAAVGGVASMLMGENGSTALFGVVMPAPVAIGTAVGLSSVAASLGHDYILPHIPLDQKYNNIESAALGIGLSGGSSAYLMSGLTFDSNMRNSFLLGAGSYVAGEYIDKKLFVEGYSPF